MMKKCIHFAYLQIQIPFLFSFTYNIYYFLSVFFGEYNLAWIYNGKSFSLSIDIVHLDFSSNPIYMCNKICINISQDELIIP